MLQSEKRCVEHMLIYVFGCLHWEVIFWKVVFEAQQQAKASFYSALVLITATRTWNDCTSKPCTKRHRTVD